MDQFGNQDMNFNGRPAGIPRHNVTPQAGNQHMGPSGQLAILPMDARIQGNGQNLSFYVQGAEPPQFNVNMYQQQAPYFAPIGGGNAFYDYGPQHVPFYGHDGLGGAVPHLSQGAFGPHHNNTIANQPGLIHQGHQGVRRPFPDNSNVQHGPIYQNFHGPSHNSSALDQDNADHLQYGHQFGRVDGVAAVCPSFLDPAPDNTHNYMGRRLNADLQPQRNHRGDGCQDDALEERVPARLVQHAGAGAPHPAQIIIVPLSRPAAVKPARRSHRMDAQNAADDVPSDPASRPEDSPTVAQHRKRKISDINRTPPPVYSPVRVYKQGSSSKGRLAAPSVTPEVAKARPDNDAAVASGDAIPPDKPPSSPRNPLFRPTYVDKGNLRYLDRGDDVVLVGKRKQLPNGGYAWVHHITGEELEPEPVFCGRPIAGRGGAFLGFAVVGSLGTERMPLAKRQKRE